jgi:N-terminal acetyltransferase B complex non-catalytic subunit
LEAARAASYAKEYFRGLQFGMGLPGTELQPADDLIIIASNVLVNQWNLSTNDTALYAAAALLEFAITKSEHSFRIRLLLIRIYRLLGTSPSSAFTH